MQELAELAALLRHARRVEAAAKAEYEALKVRTFEARMLREMDGPCIGHPTAVVCRAWSQTHETDAIIAAGYALAEQGRAVWALEKALCEACLRLWPEP